MVKAAAVVSGGGAELQSLIDGLFFRRDTRLLPRPPWFRRRAEARRRSASPAWGVGVYTVDASIFPNSATFTRALTAKLQDIDADIAILVTVRPEPGEELYRAYSGRCVCLRLSRSGGELRGHRPAGGRRRQRGAALRPRQRGAAPRRVGGFAAPPPGGKRRGRAAHRRRQGISCATSTERLFARARAFRASRRLPAPAARRGRGRARSRPRRRSGSAPAPAAARWIAAPRCAVSRPRGGRGPCIASTPASRAPSISS